MTIRFQGFTLLLSVGLFACMVLLMLLGRRVGARVLAHEPESALAGTGTIEAAIFGLMGLLVAFSFSGATSRFDARRDLIITETNAIGTAYLRIDLLPASSQPPLRDLFRQYLDSRISTYRKLPDIEAAMAEIAHSTNLQRQIWREAVIAGRIEAGAAPSANMLVLTALNGMFDIMTTRTMVTRMHPPNVIYTMLIGIELVCALIAGFGLARSKAPRWLHTIGFAAAMSIAVYVIIDIEYPRLGRITVEAFDEGFVALRRSMD